MRLPLFLIIFICALNSNAQNIFKIFDLQGQLGKYKVTMNLVFENQEINGTYRYEHLQGKNNKYPFLVLKGKVNQDGSITLDEFDSENMNNITGRIVGKINDSILIGKWESVDKSKSFSIKLKNTNYYSLSNHTVELIGAKIDGWANYSISKIIIKDKFNKPQIFHISDPLKIRELNFEIIDMNFDSIYDFRIVNGIGANGSMSYRNWLFDPKTNKFFTNAELDNVGTDPEFENFEVRTSNQCCGNHSIDRFKYNNGHYLLIQEYVYYIGTDYAHIKNYKIVNNQSILSEEYMDSESGEKIYKGTEKFDKILNELKYGIKE